MPIAPEPEVPIVPEVPMSELGVAVLGVFFLFGFFLFTDPPLVPEPEVLPEVLPEVPESEVPAGALVPAGPVAAPEVPEVVPEFPEVPLPEVPDVLLLFDDFTVLITLLKSLGEP